MRVGIIIAAAVGLSGCMSGLLPPKHVDATNYQKVVQEVKWEDDQHKQTVEITGPLAYHKNNTMAWPEYMLRASKTRDGQLRLLQLYVVANFFDWAFLDRAWSYGEPVELIQISRDVRGCSGGLCTVEEHVAINLTPEQLRSYAQSGYSVKLEGKSGEVVIQVPAAYFRAFHDALDRSPADPATPQPVSAP